MTKTIHAVYQGGVFKPSEPVSIADGTSVELTVRADAAPAAASAAAVRDFVEEIAALPLEGPQDGFSGADHDKILYGGTDAR
jgi:predicted DNA-binding antitoxin AbrB/MazE fold protein